MIASYYSIYLGKRAIKNFLDRSEDGIDKSAFNIKRAARFCNLVILFGWFVRQFPHTEQQ